MDNYRLRINNIISNYGDMLWRDSNIVGFGFGYKTIGGKFTDIPTLTIIVKNKIHENSLSQERIIPKFINGALTDVIQGGEPKFCRGETRPVYGGVSIGRPKSLTYGTVAYAVTDKGKNENLFILTCNHVINMNLTPTIGENIIQPAMEKGGNLKESFIGALHSYTPIKVGEIDRSLDYNEVDAALVLVGRNRKQNQEERLACGFLDSQIVTGTTKVTRKDKVYWWAGSTSTKKGMDAILAVENTIFRGSLDKEVNPREKVYFKNQIAYSHIAKAGDSGSLGCVQNTNKAFGLLMAGSDLLTYFNPIDRVLESLGVEFAKKLRE